METNIDMIRNNLSEPAVNNVLQWLDNPKYSIYREELAELIRAENWQELEDSFFKKLEFGTAGRRGKVGVGSNRLNLITVSESAQALAEYLSILKRFHRMRRCDFGQERRKGIYVQ